MTTSACDSPGLLTVDAVIAQLLAQAIAPTARIRLPLSAASGRVLAEDIVAPHDVPAWANSAMDGYAVAAADLQTPMTSLAIDGRLAAGDGSGFALTPGHARRIFTGAPLPAGADTVVAQEHCLREGDRISIPITTLAANVRAQGEELARGSLVLSAGTRLSANEIALLASLGQAKVSVFQPLRIGLLSTGNELREAGSALAAGQIANANGPGLAALFRGWGFDVINSGIVPDQPAALRSAFRALSSQCDVLISSGGVSVGEEDHLKAVVSELGELALWRVAIQPGKPLAFGRVGQRPWLGLPGNPTSALITAMIIAKPYLRRLQGQQHVQEAAYALSAEFSWPKAKPRRQYLRASLTNSGGVTLHAQQGSAMLSPACASDGLAMIEAGRSLVAGEPVPFLPYASLLS
tara:strand:- start:911 stop:2134 length:1224 start_codon:yes stop_codon:yes gene_type:complete